MLSKQLVQFLPRKVAFKIGEVGGKVCFKLLARERKKTIKHIKMIFGKDIDTAEIARRVFVNQGINLIEWLRMPKLKKMYLDDYFTISGSENIENVLSKGKGGIILSAHLGNWEYMSAYLFLKGYKGKVLSRHILQSKILTMKLQILLLPIWNLMVTQL